MLQKKNHPSHAPEEESPLTCYGVPKEESPYTCSRRGITFNMFQKRNHSSHAPEKESPLTCSRRGITLDMLQKRNHPSHAPEEESPFTCSRRRIILHMLWSSRRGITLQMLWIPIMDITVTLQTLWSPGRGISFTIYILWSYMWGITITIYGSPEWAFNLHIMMFEKGHWLSCCLHETVSFSVQVFPSPSLMWRHSHTFFKCYCNEIDEYQNEKAKQSPRVTFFPLSERVDEIISGECGGRWTPGGTDLRGISCSWYLACIVFLVSLLVWIQMVWNCCNYRCVILSMQA